MIVGPIIDALTEIRQRYRQRYDAASKAFARWVEEHPEASEEDALDCPAADAIRAIARAEAHEALAVLHELLPASIAKEVSNAVAHR